MDNDAVIDAEGGGAGGTRAEGVGERAAGGEGPSSSGFDSDEEDELPTSPRTLLNRCESRGVNGVISVMGSNEGERRTADVARDAAQQVSEMWNGVGTCNTHRCTLQRAF